MSTDSLQDYLNRLNSLSIDELVTLEREVKKRLDPARQFLPELISTGSVKKNDYPKEVIRLICETLSAMGVEHAHPRALEASQQYSSFCQKLPGISRYLGMAVKSKNEQRALLIIGIRQLYQNMTDLGYPISARSIMTHFHRIPSVMNSMFPGYAEMGLMGMLIGRNKEAS